MFPRYIPKPIGSLTLNKSLCFLERGILFREDGLSTVINSYEDFVDVIFKYNLMTFVENFLVSFPYIDEVIHDHQATVVCSKRGIITGIRIGRGNRSEWVIVPKTWNERWSKEDMELDGLLVELRSVFDHFGIGVHPTPSSLGYELMTQSWAEHGLLRHTKPGGSCQQFIKDHMSGGRVDTPGIGQRREIADLWDMSSGYVSKFGRQSTGTAVPFRRIISSYQNWFSRVEVRINNELPLGAFPVRELTRRGRVSYPTHPGIYNAYLWKGQVEDAASLGCDISIKGGFAWTESTTDPQFWCDQIFTKRVEAEIAGDRTLARYCKGIAVKAIGRHAGGNDFHILVDSSRKKEEDMHVSYDGHAYDYWIQRQVVQSSSNMIHWNSNTVTECNRELFKFALPFAEKGQLLATNYDSVICEDTGLGHMYPRKYTADNIFCQPGTWMYLRLHQLYIKAARTFKSKEMTVSPGVPERYREEYFSD
jgi:hypothetical protein